MRARTSASVRPMIRSWRRLFTRSISEAEGASSRRITRFCTAPWAATTTASTSLGRSQMKRSSRSTHASARGGRTSEATPERSASTFTAWRIIPSMPGSASE